MLESGKGIKKGIVNIPKYFNMQNVSNGIVAGVFNIGPLLLLTDLARRANLEEGELSAWIAAIFLVGGLLTFFLGLHYQQPINAAWTIAGAVIVGSSLHYYSFPEIACASIFAGLLVTIMGKLGVVSIVIGNIPIPIVMAMIGGTLLRFGLQLPAALLAAPFLTVLPFLGYMLLTKYSPRLPGVLGALVLGVITAAFLGEFSEISSSFQVMVASPQLVRPVFSPHAVLAVGIPLALMIMGAENMQAIGILISEGYDKDGFRVPVNAMMFYSGIATIAAALLGGHAANIAGVKTAICATGDQVPKEGKYVASLIEGVIFISIGIFAPTVLQLVAVLPEELLQLITGLALLPVLANALRIAWNGIHPMGSTMTFLVAASGISFLGIGAPLWALLSGITVALFLREGNEDKA